MHQFVWRRHYREITCLLCAALSAFAAILARPPISTDGVIFDSLIYARSALFPPGTVIHSPVAVVALDRRSLASRELAPYPRVLLAPVWAKLVGELFNAGAREVGFDEIFAYDPGNLPALPSDYNAPFLRILAAHRGHVVLARSQETPPAIPFAAAAGFNSLGLAEMKADPDGRVRHVPTRLLTATETLPTLAGLLAQRAGVTSMPDEVLLAPRRHPETIPTYAVIDVLRCASDPQALAAAFRGKVVLIGGTLPEEDRWQSSGRFLRPRTHDSRMLAPCGLRRLAASDPESTSIPGVFLHAEALETLLRGRTTSTASPMMVAAIAAIAAALGAATGLLLSPWLALGGILALAISLYGGALIALQESYWLPIAVPVLALAATPFVSYAVRYLVEERAHRLVERAFGRYLSPEIVKRLAADPAALSLGGEKREITVMFADLSGFTAMSMRVSPEVLTSAVNRYLGYVVEQVEATGGYVDKFIGDAVMAIWGAPVADSAHAVNAVRAAISAIGRIELARRDDNARGEPGFSVKIALNSGPAVVGNVGTENRYNYTAIGETVNLASRMESLPGIYHCGLVIGTRTAELVSGEFLIRELDWVLVKGANAPISIYEPIVDRLHATANQMKSVSQFAGALAAFRARQFAVAEREWSELAAAQSSRNGGAAAENPASVMAARSREFIERPPPDSWNAVNVLTSK